MLIPLEHQPIRDAMLAELERRGARFNREVLEAYLGMKIPLTRKGARSGMSPLPKTTITDNTLRHWVTCFLSQYN